MLLSLKNYSRVVVRSLEVRLTKEVKLLSVKNHTIIIFRLKCWYF